MKQIIYASFLISFFITNGQVGIGTTNPNPSAILDINSTTKGVLLPSLTTSEINEISNPANGLIFYNKDTNAIEYNSGSTENPSWTPVATSEPVSGNSFKYTNTDTTTNLNTYYPEDIPLFGSLKWNEDDTTFTTITPSSVTIGKTGRYRIVCNISLLGVNSSGKTRTGVESYIAINGSQAGAFTSSSYIRYANGNKTSSLHINEVLNLSAGDVLSIQCHQAGNSGHVRFRGASSSTILIEKIK